LIPRSTSSPDTTLAAAPEPDPAPLRAVHTTNFPALLRQLGASLLVTTYQAGKLVMVRNEGNYLNTHFRAFQAPMGLAMDGGRLAVGTAIQVWEFVDVPAVSAKLDPPVRHDACFLPRASHVTGNIQGHEMAYGAEGELWVVNTRFSCLCTLDRSASFAPRWRPPFVSALEPTGFVEPDTGRYQPIAEVPGFTRGLDFAAGHPPNGRVVVFVGLSQVRESAIFSGIPITERLEEEERTCGICVVELATGQVVALLRFETAVQEIFGVTVLPGRRWPELINDDETLLENSFVVPDAALADVPAALRAPADPAPAWRGRAASRPSRASTCEIEVRTSYHQRSNIS
jgi:hypothetical protein